jgi:hypothetical protein
MPIYPIIDGKCECPICHIVWNVAESMVPLCECDSTKTINEHSTYEELAKKIISYLENNFNNGSAQKMAESIGCNRVYGVLTGMVSAGKLLIDTEFIVKETIYSLPNGVR